ncbi:MAG: roadblock/LC7 domain-containing protein [Euryarchaeota archaeon]|nr:roadblock/LC7 domain-containing protein [Euryarchaeota archaeon]
MPSRETIDKVLHDLNNTQGIEISALLSRDGLLISSTMERNADTFAAMSATMFGAAVIAAAEFGKGMPDRVIVETKFGKLIASGARPKALIIVMARDDSTLGQILIEVSKASDRINKVFENNWFE